MPPTRRRSRRSFGSVEKLPTGFYRVRYTGPDGQVRQAVGPNGKGLRFSTKGAADAHLATLQADMLRGQWEPPHPTPAPQARLFADYADEWVTHRQVKGKSLAIRTREHYAQLLRDHLNPTFGTMPIDTIDVQKVTAWYRGLSTGPTAKAHAYGFLKSIFATAVNDDLVPKNPCRIRGAGQADPVTEIRPATVEELEAIVQALPERYRLMTLLAAWCAFRFGELTELRRSDVDLKSGTIRISRGVVRTRDEGMVAKDPKSAAGRRVVTVPNHLMPMLEEHIRDALVGADGLLFPSAQDPTKHMMNSSFSKVWLRARAQGGRPDLRFHDLRHTGATFAARAGAPLRQLMARLGHATPQAALRYQHASLDQDRIIADRLSRMALGEEPGD